MSGNVWEWCRNKYDKVDDVATGGGDLRVLRGGSWVYDQDVCRAAVRIWGNPVARSDDFGFRLCLSSPIKDR
jgi:formylglycine-generating enzyme required for sulfatase activity